MVTSRTPLNCDFEVIHIIAGRLDLTLGESIVHLHAGDTLTFNGRRPHTWANSSDELADVLWALIPRRGAALSNTDGLQRTLRYRQAGLTRERHG